MGHVWKVELHVRLGNKLTQVERLGLRSVRLADSLADAPYTRVFEIEGYERRPYLRLDRATLFVNALTLATSVTLPCYIDWSGRECAADLVLTP